MCSLERVQLKESALQWCSTSCQVGYWSGLQMDNLSEVVASHSLSAPISNDCKPRLKLLCSFSGSIMPRPQDGMLRYVGGETRIVSLPRDTSYAELMARMRELYEGAVLLKYQQPDEDLDALVSVVNDDDLTNMIEEYDKFGSCEGFARLRVFLFTNSEQDTSFQFIDVDGRDSERRYVDALNNFSDASDFRSQQLVAPSLVNPIDEVHIAEQFLNQVDLEGGGSPNQKNFEVPKHHIQLRHLKIPQMGLGHHQQQPASHRYNDTEAPWSPVHHSPMLGHHDPWHMGEIPCSPSVHSHTHADLWEITSEDYNMHNLNSQCQYEYQTQFSEAWMPSGFVSADKAGYRGNLHHGFDAYQGNNVRESFKMAYPQNKGYLDFRWKHGPQSEQEVENEVHTFVDNRETYFPNTVPTIHHGCPAKEHTELRCLRYESPRQDSGCTLPPYVRIENDECKGPFSSESTLPQHGNLCDCPPLSSNYIHLEDTRYVPARLDLGNDLYHGHVDQHMLQFGNFPYATNDASQSSHLMGHPQRFSASFQNSAHSSFGMPMPMLQNNDLGFLKNTVGCSPRFQRFEENQGPLYSSPKGPVPDGFVVSDNACNHSLKINPDAVDMSHFCISGIDRLRSEDDLKYADNIGPVMDSSPSLTLVDNNKIISPSFCSGMSGPRSDAPVTETVAVVREIKETKQVKASEGIFISDDCGPRRDVNKMHVVLSECENATQLQSIGMYVLASRSNSYHPVEDAKVSDPPLSCLSNEVAALNRVGLGKTEKVSSGGFENSGTICSQRPVNLRASSGQLGSQVYSENDHMEFSKIELTEAEEEAISRGLQTIKNDDLEEIKELGSGTYGAVYHGKWKGSDVAIKRIKASCFTGRPSERERLIADFWKEALILSSLHHPNVVSFYGIVRDGPDGSLATVTEFMINGSLKQFLQKKDRTIDRRKRLIITMDTAFGMEYLHGKNIVHFDLKCENLLVNMRDPHRPVCKIGDLGLSKVKQHTLVSGGVRGTLPWMAPELLSGKNNMVTEKIDVYSFGIVMWELLTGEEPYADMHCATMIGRIVNDMLRPEIPSWCDPEWRALMESCWASDPAERPPFSEISQKLRAMAAAINVK